MSILKANKNMISPKGKKILFFVGSMNAGGAERVAATLANAWASQGYQVRLVMTHLGSKSSFYPLLDQVDCVPLADFFQPSWVAPRLVAKWQAIRHVFYEFQPDVVLSFLTNVNINVLWALRRQRVPIIVSERTHPLYSRSSGYFLKWLRKRLYPRASAVVLQTQAAAEAFQTVTPGLKKVVVIPNPIPPKLLQFAMH